MSTCSANPTLVRNLVAALLSGVLWTSQAFGDSAGSAADSLSIPEVKAGNHAGYYYPALTSREVYTSRTAVLPGSDRRRRVTFITQFMAQTMGRSHAPGYAIYAKGDDAQKLIITATGDGRFNTLFRMRGLLAVLTSQARGSELFQSAQVDDLFTFLDLLRLIGFEQLTVTDGRHFAHQFTIK